MEEDAHFMVARKSGRERERERERKRKDQREEEKGLGSR
jgi:hypothetical protein